VLASDGLWDVMTNYQVARWVIDLVDLILLIYLRLRLSSLIQFYHNLPPSSHHHHHPSHLSLFQKLDF